MLVLDRDKTVTITFLLNGVSVQVDVNSREHLADMLRRHFKLTGTHIGCEHGICGACSLMMDDAVVRGCLALAVQADGSDIRTIEGLTDDGSIADLQASFVARNALQCGFCTPGMLATAAELLKQERELTRREIREAISGNFCRCTGYQAITDAIESVSLERRRAHK